MSPDRKNHHIVIVPGLNEPAARFDGVCAELAGAGLTPHVFLYPSKEWPIDRAALMLASHVEKEVLHGEQGRSLSVVGFGTGSLVARCYLSHYEVLPARRCVVIADPRHATDRYRGRKPGWLGHWRYGPAIAQLAAGPDGMLGRCGNPPVPYGVIVTGTTPDATADKCDNEAVRDSLYTPPTLLKGARAVIYDATSAQRAAAERAIQTYIAAFLQHGWFVEA